MPKNGTAVWRPSGPFIVIDEKAGGPDGPFLLFVPILVKEIVSHETFFHLEIGARVRQLNLSPFLFPRPLAE